MNLEDAVKYVCNAFYGIKTKDGSECFLHSLSVMLKLSRHVSVDNKYYLTIKEIEILFGKEVSIVVGYLTKSKGTNYIEYVRFLKKENKLAYIIKYFDMNDNLERTSFLMLKNEKEATYLVNKYTQALKEFDNIIEVFNECNILV